MNKDRLKILIEDVFNDESREVGFSEDNHVKLIFFSNSYGYIGCFTSSVYFSPDKARFNFPATPKHKKIGFILELLNENDKIVFLQALLEYIIQYLKEHHPTYADGISNIDDMTFQEYGQGMGYQFK
jgi:hypothetical protein